MQMASNKQSQETSQDPEDNKVTKLGSCLVKQLLNSFLVTATGVNKFYENLASAVERM